MSTTTFTWTVGAELEPVTPPAITRTTLALFAGASGDHNPMHIDIDFARAAGRDDVFAHGMLSMAYLARVLTSVVGIDAIRSLSTRFASITPVGAQMTCTGTVTELIEGEEPQARVELVATTAEGTVLLRGEAVVAVPAAASTESL